MAGYNDYISAMAQQSEANNVFNARQAELNREFQQNMSDTAHQREVKDLIAAGLNPILSANTGASTASGSMATADTSSAQGYANLANTGLNNITQLALAEINKSAQLQAAQISAQAVVDAAEIGYKGKVNTNPVTFITSLLSDSFEHPEHIQENINSWLSAFGLPESHGDTSLGFGTKWQFSNEPRKLLEGSNYSSWLKDAARSVNSAKSVQSAKSKFR